MKRLAILFFSALLLALLTHSCTSASKDQLVPAGCHTDIDTNYKATYTTDIVPIFQYYCYSCHGSNTNATSGGINLEDPNTLSKYLDDGKLSGNINHFPGYNAMPPSPAPIMPDCQLKLVNNWINQGGPLN